MGLACLISVKILRFSYKHLKGVHNEAIFLKEKLRLEIEKNQKHFIGVGMWLKRISEWNGLAFCSKKLCAVEDSPSACLTVGRMKKSRGIISGNVTKKFGNHHSFETFLCCLSCYIQLNVVVTTDKLL